MQRTNVSSPSPMEDRIGFSRAARIGDLIAVSGTAPIAGDGTTACPGDVHGQTRRALAIARRAIEDAGGRLEDVIRVRIMLVDIGEWEAAARAHHEVFAAIRPACTFVEVSRFVDPDWLVEVEIDCVTG